MTKKRLALAVFLIAFLASAVGSASIKWDGPVAKDSEVTFRWSKPERLSKNAPDQTWCFREAGETEFRCKSECDNQNTCSHTFEETGSAEVQFTANGNFGPIDKKKVVTVEE